MRNTIITKIIILLLLCLIFLPCCKNEKICDIETQIQHIYGGEDISILKNALDCNIKREENIPIILNSNINENVCLIGTRYIRKKATDNPITYLWFYEDESDYTKGMIILLLSRFRKIKGNGSSKKIIDTYSLKDYVLVPGFSSNITHFENVSYGEPNIEHGCTSYNTDKNIYGIYAYEGKYPPYNKKVMPKYLVYVENGKLVVEEPKDDKYFIYRIPEL